MSTDLNNAVHRLRQDHYPDDQDGRDARQADIEHLSHALGLAEGTIERLVGALAREVNGLTLMGEPAPHQRGEGILPATQAPSAAVRTVRPAYSRHAIACTCGAAERDDCTCIRDASSNAPRPAMQFTLGQAETLLAFFGGSNGDMTVEYFPANHWPDSPEAPAGLYVYCTEYPEEGAQWLGREDNSEEIEPTWQHIPPAAEFQTIRLSRQRVVHDWCVAAFGDDHAKSIEQRGIRLVEEAIETGQACQCSAGMVHRLVDHIYSKPVGDIDQELGGVGVTMLALAQAAGLDADDAEQREIARVLSKPLEHFAARNAAKNAAGFNVSADPTPTPGTSA